MFKRRPQAIPARITTDSQRLRILDYRQYARREPRKRALLSYLVEPVAASLRSEKIVRFSNHGLAVSWAQVLNEMGYIVDIISWDDLTFESQKQYDLVVLHGAKNYKALSDKLSSSTPIIYFATGTYWRFSNDQENARLANIQKRHGVTLPRDRYVNETEDEVNAAAKGIIALGNAFIQSTYQKYPLVVGVNNASYPDDHFNANTKDYAALHNNFLFFAGAGNVHKGLDLLLDSFEGLDQHLYIVTVYEPAFQKAFKKYFSLPNIHWLGEVNMRTPEFYSAMDLCPFIIFPSCSEGQAGSVVEAMNQGLVPIVSKETSLNVQPFGLELNDTSVATIRSAIEEMSGLRAAEIRERSILSRHAATHRHSPERFKKDLRRAIETILKA